MILSPSADQTSTFVCTRYRLLVGVLVALAFVPLDRARAQAVSPPGGLEYAMSPGEKFAYDVAIRVSIGDYQISYTGVINYEVLQAQQGRVKLKYRGSLNENRNLNSSDPFDRMQFHRSHIRSLSPFFRSPFGGTRAQTNTIWISKRGEVVAREGESQLPLFLGNASDLVFEVLPDGDQTSWQTEDTVSLREVEEEDDFGPRFGPRFGPFRQPETKTYTMVATKTHSIESVEGDIVAIKVKLKVAPLEADTIGDLAAMNGEGTWKFHRGYSVPESMEFERTLVHKLGGATLNIPVVTKYTRLTEEQLAAREEAARKAAAEAKKRFEEMRAKREPPPPPTDEMKQQWAGQLQDEDAAVRESAAKSLGPVADEAFVDVLLSALDDSSPVVRQQVMRALGRLKVVEAAEPIAARLADESDQTAAMAALRQIGPPAGPAVLASLDAESPLAREAACRLATRIDWDAEGKTKAIEQLAACIADQDQRVKAAAASALSRLVAAEGDGDPKQAPVVPAVPDRLLQVLAGGMKSSSPDGRFWALRLVAITGPQARSLSPAVAQCMNDAEPEVRQAASAAMLAIAQGGTDPDEQDQVDPAAVDRIVPPKLPAWLGGLLDDADPAVRYWSTGFLGVLGEDAADSIPKLIRLTEDDQLAVRSAAVRSLQAVCLSISGGNPLEQEAESLAEQINALGNGTEKKASQLGSKVLAELDRIWPIQAERDSAFGSRGRQSTTGENSAEWFGYGGAGDWKVFPVQPDRKILLRTRGDGQLVDDIQFSISEQVDGKWQKKETVNGPKSFSGYRWYFYTPETDRVRIDADGYFYVYMYQL